MVVVDRVLELILGLPAAETTRNYGEKDSRVKFKDALKSLVESLDLLGERHIPEARVPSPCGQSRWGTAICWPWINLVGCHDACGICREQAKRALRLLREGVVDGKPSEKFIAPEVAAALIERATQAREWEARFGERSRDRMRAQWEALRQRESTRKKNPHPPGMNAVEHAVLMILIRAQPTQVLAGKDILKTLDNSGLRERLSQGNLTSRIIPALVRKGVPIENGHPGYWIDWNRAPAWLAAMRSNAQQ